MKTTKAERVRLFLVVYLGGRADYSGSCIDQTQMKIDVKQPEEWKLWEVAMEFIAP